MFAAVASHELLTPGPADPEVAVDDPDSLAAYDRPATQRGDLEMDRGGALLQHEAALEATGLQLSPSVFVPGLDIADGRRFAQAITEVPQDDQTLRGRVAAVVGRALDTAARTQIPPEFDEFHPSHLGEPPNPEDPQTLANNQTVAELLSNTHAIASGLEELDANPQLVASLRTAHAAEVEGVLPLYGPYRKWGLDGPPTTRDTDREWTQWLYEEEWQPFHTYVDRVAAEAPEGSRFAHDMAATAIDHIQRARDGVYVESEHPPLSIPEPDDDDWGLDDLVFRVDNSPEAVAEREEFARQYDALLARAQERLRTFL